MRLVAPSGAFSTSLTAFRGFRAGVPPGRYKGTRELVDTKNKYPYVLIYRIETSMVAILRVSPARTLANAPPPQPSAEVSLDGVVGMTMRSPVSTAVRTPSVRQGFRLQVTCTTKATARRG
jgi:hypothetical protein